MLRLVYLMYINYMPYFNNTKQQHTDLKVPSHPMFHHRLPVPPDEKEEEEEETYDEINIMRPLYGVTSIEWNYVQYNTSRSKKDEVGIL